MGRKRKRDLRSRAETVTGLLRMAPGAVDLSAVDTSATPGFDGGKNAGRKALAALDPHVSSLQEQLYAEGVAGGSRSVLLVLQGMDTSGKGGTIRHSIGQLDPQGVTLASFKAPTAEERRHDFLWRIRRRVPRPGLIGIFDRSHYEDVLAARVRELAPKDEIELRYDAINDFEAELARDGTTVIKCFLHISREEQCKRLQARLDDPTKHWKFNPGDIDDRALWDGFQDAYEIALRRCNADIAPWFVIPADRKWYRNWAVTKLLGEHLERLGPQWPPADFDVEEQRRRLLAEC
jgi:PPK2 family polyphosphate:nucleotide phosphotransferase